MKEHKKELIEMALSVIILILAIVLKQVNETASLILYLVSYIVIGKDIIIEAVGNLFKGELLDENFLMTVSTIGALCIKEYPEAVVVMLLYKIGELFEDYAVDKSRKSIENLMNIRPDYANVVRDGNILKINPEEVELDEIIEIKSGEKIPLDGIVIEGSSMLDTSSLTGESVPREVIVGDNILSGCINLGGLLKVKVTKKFEESTVNKILDLIENATSKKSKSENFITKFAKYYTPIVVCLALALAIIPPIVIKDASFSMWLSRALTFLVISCPCALVISVPLSFFGGIGGASKKGILIKGSNYLEALSKVDTIVMDKTGTLTKGVFKVQEIYPKNITKEDLLKLTVYAEYNSNHPISVSLKTVYSDLIDTSNIQEIEELTGLGVKAKVFEKNILVGNAKLMNKYNIEFEEVNKIGTIVYVAVENEYVGYILIADELKKEIADSICNMKDIGIRKTVMLTGDKKSIGEEIAKSVKIDEVYTELLPTDKFEKLEEIIAKEKNSKKVAFVGDGINDAPSLARADVGIAMGAMGSDAAIEAADVIIMTDEISKIIDAVNISKKTLKIVKQNIIFALGVKALVLVLGALGISNLWEAVFADVGVTVIAILNAMRAMKSKK